MNKLKNSVAVVTGAASGIGSALADELAARGATVAISDVDVDGINTKAEAIKAQGFRVHARALDVSDRAAVFAYADEVEQDLGPVNLVINNAGVALASGTLMNTTLEEFEWLMGINFSGVLYGTKAFLPKMKDSEWGHIVNISSLFGLIGVAEQSAYNSSKFAVRGMTEALRLDLELSNSHISATSVHPGGIKTNIAVNSKPGDNLSEAERQGLQQRALQFEKIAKTTPASAAKQIIDGTLKNKRRILVGNDAKLMDWLQRHFPNHYHKVMAFLLRKETGERSILGDGSSS